MMSNLSFFPLVLTITAFWIGQQCQLKWKKAIFNPILIGSLITGLVLVAADFPRADYADSMGKISWLMAPATISLAVPMYEQFQLLRKNLKAIAAGVIAGTLASLLCLVLGGLLFRLETSMTLSLLPKSVTTAIGVPLSQLYGGVASITTVTIIATGILANMIGPLLFKAFRIDEPVAQGVALGTSGHVVGTSRANDIGPLTGAVSSLSLVIAGLLTAIVMPVVVSFL